MTSPATASAPPHPLAPARAAVRAAADPAAPVDDARVPCPECGAAIAERFCGRCGEERPEAGALRLRHLVGELVEHLTSLDFKLVRTLVALVRHPGTLTREFVAGRRARYTRPLALYLFMSGAFFVLAPHLPVHGNNPRNFVDNRNPSPALAHHFDAVAARHGETRAQLADRVERSPFVGSRYSAALLVPETALVLGVLLAGRRRLLAEHVLFSIHLESFLLVALGVGLGGVWPAGRLAGLIGRSAGIQHLTDLGASILAGSLVLLLLGWLASHVHLALRRVYDLDAWGAAWRTAALLVSLPLGFYFGQFALVEFVAVTGLR